MEQPLTYLTFFYFRGFFPKYIAISVMGIAKIFHPNSKHSIFSKLLGTGSGNGFSNKPDLGKYALITISKTQNFEKYIPKIWVYPILKRFAYKTEYFKLECLQSKGKWDQQMVYYETKYAGPSIEDRIAVLTRAKVRKSKLFKFWKLVPSINKQLEVSKGLTFSAGLGEWPFSHPITYSVWKNTESMNAFAHTHHSHSSAIKAAYEGKWFYEDLFVRYKVLEQKTLISEGL